MQQNLARQRYQTFSSTFIPVSLTTYAWIINLAVTLYYGVYLGGLHDTSNFFSIIICILGAVTSALVIPVNFSVGFLISSFLLLIHWRIAAMAEVTPIIIISSMMGVLYLLLFLDCMRKNWLLPENQGRLSGLEWQATTVRIYFAFDMVGHFTEKLFAGTASFYHMGDIFRGFGVGHPQLMVIIGGCCEIGIAIGIGMGFLTRLAAVGGMLYFMIANHFGDHFAYGFTWSNEPGGGWEYPMLMAIFYLSFALSGAGKFSIDNWLIERKILPNAILSLCIPRANQVA
ncbi:DoxX family protein [Rouxiella badensis]|uniref:DoxX family protein n=1 Tax=Rouxiella badensis TaxID=1646377 RepID=UPI00301BB0EB